jgi:uncharacterized protein YkwD
VVAACIGSEACEPADKALSVSAYIDVAGTASATPDAPLTAAVSTSSPAPRTHSCTAYDSSGKGIKTWTTKWSPAQVATGKLTNGKYRLRQYWNVQAPAAAKYVRCTGSESVVLRATGPIQAINVTVKVTDPTFRAPTTTTPATTTTTPRTTTTTPRTTTTTATTTTTIVRPVDVAAIESGIVSNINAARAARTVVDTTARPVLTLNTTLTTGAQRWSREMALRAGYVHDPDGAAVFAPYQSAAEIIYHFTVGSSDPAVIARVAVDAWLASKPHCGSVMHPGYGVVGAGVYLERVEDPDFVLYDVWATVRFAGMGSTLPTRCP